MTEKLVEVALQLNDKAIDMYSAVKDVSVIPKIAYPIEFKKFHAWSNVYPNRYKLCTILKICKLEQNSYQNNYYNLKLQETGVEAFLYYYYYSDQQGSITWLGEMRTPKSRRLGT